MSRAPRVKRDQFLRAIPGCKGVQANIARALGVERATVSECLKRWPEAQQAFNDEVERWGDEVENVIHTAIEDFDSEIALPMAKWYASRKLKHRGYGDQQQVTGDPTQPITIKVVYESENEN